MLRYCTVFAVLAGCALPSWAQDDTLDWVLSHATTAPTTMAAPATRPLAKPTPAQAQALSGSVTLSDGSTISGPISTTPGKPIRIWVEQQHAYTDVPLEQVRRIEATVLWERMEREWHFIASGSDVKEYTGRTYPARELQFTFTLAEGGKITGATVAPLYMQLDDQQRLIVLPKRQKGELGTDLAHLLYPKLIEISGRSTP